MSKKEKFDPTVKKVRRMKRNRVFLKILVGFFCVIAIFIGVTYGVTQYGNSKNLQLAKSFDKVETKADVVLDNYSNGCWNVTYDGKLKVMQLTDVHLGGGWLSISKDSMAINAVASMVTAEKPDLIVVTGDIAYPVPFQAGTMNNLNGAKLFATLMETLGVPWTVVFGNHDSEAYSYYNRQKVSDFYENGGFGGCLYQSGPADVDGNGNQVINLCATNGLVRRSLILFDSHSYTDGDTLGIMWKYDNIHENQIEWYRNTVNTINLKNAELLEKIPPDSLPKNVKEYKTVKTSAFMHIPMEEYKTAWFEYINNGSNDTDDVKYIGGVAGEDNEIVYCGIHPDELFETILELGSTDSVFCGHDHKNYFSVNYKGIQLNYSKSVDYLAYIGIYKYGAQRGCTVIDINKNGDINITSENYYQEKFVSKYEKETVIDIENNILKG